MLKPLSVALKRVWFRLLQTVQGIGGREPSTLIGPGQFLAHGEALAASVPSDPAEVDPERDLLMLVGPTSPGTATGAQEQLTVFALSGPGVSRALGGTPPHDRVTVALLFLVLVAMVLADIDSPTLCFVGDVDEIARPVTVRGILRAAPRALPAPPTPLVGRERELDHERNGLGRIGILEACQRSF